ncbi:TPR-like protein [Zopfia rhizophila CBS 207.26]|uniref:TPR-like protein n=1 Tax=Zopfia rhizophila CBS 207.26 TaxID=1314779 RepID=A0A6A6DHE6_9PEZI|nr:TPR-like protein [Zopfia rhizophila CBS 207.26]
MQQTSEFNGPIEGHIVIPAPHNAGGTMNFNFGYQSRQDRQSRKREPFSTVPFASDPDFVDRPDILAWIRDKCAGPGARAALVGLGGVGKSQIAIRYSYGIRDALPQTFVFWVHASTQARFEEAYRDIADRLELPGRENPKADVLRLVSNWLCDETNGQWMMVLDNVDDVETFFPKSSESSSPSLAAYVPQSPNGSILITSRNKDAASRLAGGLKNTKEVHTMDNSQGLQLLQNKLQDAAKEEGAADLLYALDYIPLAITQAAVYINRRSRMTASGYLNEFRKNEKKKKGLLNWDCGDLRRDLSVSNSVVTTWQISFERIRQERPSAADLLSLMSFFNPQGIPESVLQRYSENAAETCNRNEPSDEFNEDFDTLLAFSLIAVTADNDICEMHGLVQFCTQVWLSSSGDGWRWRQKFVKLVAQEFPTGQFENWGKCQRLLPHIESLYDAEPTSDDYLKDWAQILTNAAWYMWMMGKYKAAQGVATKALAAREQVLGKDNQMTLTSVVVLAGVLQDQGKYSEAEKLHRRALEGYEKELGVQHPSTLTSVGNLAGVLESQGKYSEAEKLNRLALEGREKELGVQHPDTLTSVSNLALVLQYQGKYSEAEKLNRRALEGRKKELGVQHPNTLMSVSNLALVLVYQGKYSEAEKLNRRALEGREKELGVQHPDTLTSVNNLAAVLGYQGKYSEAEKLNRRALERREKELGVQHPSTLTSVNDLALVLQYQGKYGEAEQLNRRALEGYEKELGVQHPSTLTSVNDLALVLQYQGKYGEAEQLNRRALEGYEKELGVQHPSTLTSVYSLAYLLHKQRRHPEAAELYQRACSGYQQKLGPQHPTTIACTSNYADMQREMEHE